MKFKILTYNIHKGFNTLGTKLVLNGIRQSIRETQADILFLQEVVGENHDHIKNHKDWPTESQFEFLADQVWSHFSYGKNAIFSNRHHGNAILSKFPIDSQENLNISNHRFEQRGLLHCQVTLPNHSKKIHLFNTHIDLLAHGRKRQVEKINLRLKHATEPTDSLILCGDFNDWHLSVDKWMDPTLNLREAHTHLHGHPAKTFPGFLPTLKLDRVYFRGLTVESCKRLENRPWNQLSDHLPLLAEFDIDC